MNSKNGKTVEPKIIVLAVLIIGVFIILGGIYFIATEKFAEIELSILGSNFTSTSVGLSMIFIGAMLVLNFGVRVVRLFRPQISVGGVGGSAEVIGDGEARGGKGGHSGPFGPGGKGGDARVIGRGKAKGGEGGDG